MDIIISTFCILLIILAVFILVRNIRRQLKGECTGCRQCSSCGKKEICSPKGAAKK